MKIDANTIQILKNFAKINPSIIVPEGNVIRTISPSRTIVAKAVTETTFDKRFAIYNLDRFIATLSLFNEPELDFGDRAVTISNGSKKTHYTYADESTVKTAQSDVKLPSVDVSFMLTNDVYKGQNHSW